MPANIKEIKNKDKRREIYLKLKADIKKQKKEEKKQLLRNLESNGEQELPKQEPKTLDSTREKEDTLIQENDEEYLEDINTDEFSKYFSGEIVPKIMITTRPRPSKNIHLFVGEIMNLIPNCYFYKRNTQTLKEMMKYAGDNSYTHIIAVNEKNKVVNSMFLSHLNGGPTAYFKISSFVPTEDIKGHGNATGHFPEVICNRFVTRLGCRVSRILGSIFPHNPAFKGRRVVTFHNQRDFIFVRHHRYIFDSKNRAKLQELGPRFTLKFRSLQVGDFSTICGEYEWVYNHKQFDTSRRKYHL